MLSTLQLELTIDPSTLTVVAVAISHGKSLFHLQWITFFPTSLCGVLVFDSASRPPPSASRRLLASSRLTHLLTHNLHTHNLLTHNLHTHTQLTHTHTTYSHTQLTVLTHTQLAYTHTQLTHTQLAHTHTTYSHTTYSHTQLAHTHTLEI